MPYKDPEKQKECTANFHKTAYHPSILFRFRKDTESHIQEALEKAVLNTGIKTAVYARTALIEKLVRDGYLRED